MAIPYSNGNYGSGSGVNIGTSIATAAALNDYILIAVSEDSSSATYTWPSGFTQIGIQHTADETSAVAYKIGGASEPTSYNVVSSTGQGFSWGLAVWSGEDISTFHDVTPTSQTLSSSTSPWNVTALGVASGSANRKLIWIGCVDNQTSGSVTSAVPSASPATWTERIDHSSSSWTNIAICDCDDTAGTYTSDVTGVQTLGTATGGRMAYLIALRAATGGAAFIAPVPYIKCQTINRSRTY